jgi:ABC-type molybdate transport system substrate-binding protein
MHVAALARVASAARFGGEVSAMRPDPLRNAAQCLMQTPTGIGRRRLLQALPAAAIITAASRARAASSADELVLACDTTLGPVMRAAASIYADRTGEQVNVFPTGLGLLVPQLERDVQNDIIVTQVSTIDAAVQANVVSPGAARGAWANHVVLAAVRGASPMPDRPIAISDPVSDMDSRSILAQLQLMPTNLLGVIDTDTVVAVVLNGTARAGLMHMTDLRAHPELEVIRDVSNDIQAPIAYAAAVTRLTSRPDPDAFIDYLLTGRAATMLASLGLETPSSP